MNHYIVFSSFFPYYSYGYNDLKHNENVTYVEDLYPQRGSKLLYLLYRIFFSARINKLFRVPFKSLFYSTFLPSGLDVNKEYRFLLFGEERLEFLSYLKKRFKKSKFIYYRQDIFSKNPEINVLKFKQHWDLCLCYDKYESEKYGLLYYETPYSILPVKIDKNYTSDVFYLGAAKNRLDEILLSYDSLTSKGFLCKFFIVDSYNYKVPEEIKNKYKNIEFLSTKGMTYGENLKYVMNTKCVLEIMQKSADGLTPRVWETIAYDKILLTNNISLKQSTKYNEKFMFVCDSTFDCVDRSILNITVSYPQSLKSSMSPNNLISFIEEHLNK